MNTDVNFAPKPFNISKGHPLIMGQHWSYGGTCLSCTSVALGHASALRSFVIAANYPARLCRLRNLCIQKRSFTVTHIHRADVTNSTVA